MSQSLVKAELGKIINVVNSTDRGYRKVAEMRADDERLRLAVGYTADAEIALHFLDVMLELGAERRVFDIVYRALKAVFAVYGETSAAGSEVRMVVSPEKQIKDTACL